MFVLMEFAHRCDTSGVRCLLNWRPRDANQEADRIAKNDFSDFCMDHKVAVSWDELVLSVLPSMLRLQTCRAPLMTFEGHLLKRWCLVRASFLRNRNGAKASSPPHWMSLR